jgi:hypothetical protein
MGSSFRKARGADIDEFELRVTAAANGIAAPSGGNAHARRVLKHRSRSG